MRMRLPFDLLGAVIAVGFSAVAVVAAMATSTDDAPPPRVQVSGPDQHGVVCYRIAGADGRPALSCVHVPQKP